MIDPRHLVEVFTADRAGPQFLGRLDVPHPKPLHLVIHGGGFCEEAFRRAVGPTAGYAGRSVVLYADAGSGEERPLLANPRPDRIDLLPPFDDDGATWRTMRRALDLWAPGRNRRSFQGPAVASLAPGPSLTVQTVLLGPPSKAVLQRAGHPHDWPAEVLDFVFASTARVMLDPNPPGQTVWRGRPAKGCSYVRVVAAPATFAAWRRAILACNQPATEVACLAAYRKRRR